VSCFFTQDIGSLECGRLFVCLVLCSFLAVFFDISDRLLTCIAFCLMTELLKMNRLFVVLAYGYRVT